MDKIILAALIIIATTIIELIALKYRTEIVSNDIIKLFVLLIIALDVLVLLQLIADFL